MTLLTRFLAAAPLALAGFGCAATHSVRIENAFHEPFGDPYPHVATATHPAPAVADTTTELVIVDLTLAARCQLPGAAVYFEFDSAELGAWSQEYLHRVATCVTTGPAAGEGIELVGRADPRGTDDYNYDLGMSRAEAVANSLRADGVPPERVLLVSRGEETASPDPARWPVDRRVTMRLHTGASPSVISSR